MLLAGTDRNLFHLDWDRTGEVLIAIIILSLLVERALSVLFESRWFIEKGDDLIPKEWVGRAENTRRRRLRWQSGP